MDLAKLATLLFINGNVHPYLDVVMVDTWMWAEILFNALLASSGCDSFAPFLPVLTFAQSVQLALQWAGDAQRAIPKRKLAHPLRPVSLLRRLRPLPQGSPHYRLTFITHIHLGASHVTLAPFALLM